MLSLSLSLYTLLSPSSMAHEMWPFFIHSFKSTDPAFSECIKFPNWNSRLIREWSNSAFQVRFVPRLYICKYAWMIQASGTNEEDLRLELEKGRNPDFARASEDVCPPSQEQGRRRLSRIHICKHGQSPQRSFVLPTNMFNHQRERERERDCQSTCDGHELVVGNCWCDRQTNVLRRTVPKLTWRMRMDCETKSKDDGGLRNEVTMQQERSVKEKIVTVLIAFTLTQMKKGKKGKWCRSRNERWHHFLVRWP